MPNMSPNLSDPGRIEWAPGTVLLAGAGPGDPDLLTLRAARAVATAEIILHDALVDERILALAGGRLVDVGKRCGRHRMKQADINAALVAAAASGARVLRLKGGDPMVFGRANEEIQALRSAGFEPVVIPGITAASAAAAALGISLTARETARSVTFITGHSSDGRLAPQDWSALVRHGGTLAFYMGVRQASAIADRLIEAGLDPGTPVQAVSNAARPSQDVWTGRLVDLAEAFDDIGLGKPAVILVGAGMRVPDAGRAIGWQLLRSGLVAIAGRQGTCQN